jgi:glucose-6-phosphate isomerase
VRPDSVNVSDEPFITMLSNAADADQNYDLIPRAGAMETMVIQDGAGWRAVPNPDHTGYQL